MNEEVFKAGKEACLAGYGTDKNPYTENDTEYFVWLAGYFQCKDMIDILENPFFSR